MKKRTNESPAKTQQRQDIHKADQKKRKPKLIDYAGKRIIPLKSLKEMEDETH